jgi:hypothetical protein
MTMDNLGRGMHNFSMGPGAKTGLVVSLIEIKHQK